MEQYVVALIVLGVSAAALGAFGCVRLVQAFVTGRVCVRLTADRATQPVRFWWGVAVLVLVVGVSTSSLVKVAVASRVSGTAFHARHPVALPDVTDEPVEEASADACRQPSARVCFVAAGAAPDVPVDRLASYFSTRLGSPVGILDPIALTKQAGGIPVIDERRLQVGVGGLGQLVRRTYPTLWGDRDLTLVILTGHDLWLESGPGERYVFGSATAWSGGGGVAMVSSARMDPNAYREAADPVLLERRMHVLVGKYLALLRYGASPSTDPTSPVYNAVRSPADLDRMQLFSPPS